MISWNNLDTVAAFKELEAMKDRVDIKTAMAGENGAERVAKYSTKMAGGLAFNYAAKQIDDEVLNTMASVAKEQQLVEKYKALLNDEVINTGEKRLVLHQLARRQQLDDVVVDGVNKGEFYAAQTKKLLILLTKFTLARLQMLQARNSQQYARLVSVDLTLDHVLSTLH